MRDDFKGQAVAKVADHPDMPCSGFCFGLALTILGFVPAMIGGFVLVALVNSNAARLEQDPDENAIGSVAMAED